MLRTFLDAGILITGARGSGADQERALHILEDPERVFVASLFLQLELVPKAVFHKKHLEKLFYDKYFERAELVRNMDEIVRVARAEAARCGLSAMDALHLAAAHLGGCEEFITTERPTAPIFRSTLVQIIYLFG